MYIGLVRVKERMGGFGSYPSRNEVRYDMDNVPGVKL